jgi:hypothetical protein
MSPPSTGPTDSSLALGCTCREQSSSAPSYYPASRQFPSMATGDATCPTTGPLRHPVRQRRPRQRLATAGSASRPDQPPSSTRAGVAPSAAAHDQPLAPGEDHGGGGATRYPDSRLERRHAVRRASRRAEQRCSVRSLGARAAGVCRSVVRSHPAQQLRRRGA